MFFHYLLVSCFIQNIDQYNNYEENEIIENSRDWTFDATKFSTKDAKEYINVKQLQSDKSVKFQAKSKKPEQVEIQEELDFSPKKIYKPKKNYYMLKKLKNASLEGNIKDLVSKQIAMKQHTNERLLKKKNAENVKIFSKEENSRTTISVILECIDNPKPAKFDTRLVSII